ncbi:sugar phosphate isomerase/epimerase [Leifsonia xyli subsp. cynodontis DSM 46306]|uniref:Xylose isomerase-like TIM barrel domain-containing protein n=2 Tax=Leifsonia xyli TaxID=1575 RepID=U3PFQ5_LEIXC|nr:sugar phosphate isomerase/epimerase [Leifsonia xyli subsp. cynodontis DSM 46306]
MAVVVDASAPGVESSRSSSAVSLGIYEKALRNPRSPRDWDRFFAEAAGAGFSFVDLSVDETPSRRARLAWPASLRRQVRDSAAHAGVRLGGLCLSAHRGIGPGSADPAVRAEAAAIYRDGIRLAHDLGMSVLQVVGYYAYYEEPDQGQRRRWVDVLAQAVALAAREGVILGIENVDGHDITSIGAAMRVVEEIGSPWLQLYPDIGNLAEQQLDTRAELAVGAGRMVALHVKDVRVGEPRRVPFGEGIAQFDVAFSELARQDWCGRLMLEMWNDDADDSAVVAARSRDLVALWLADAGIPVVHDERRRPRRTVRSDDA